MTNPDESHALPPEIAALLDKYRTAIIRVCNDLADDDRDADQFDESCARETAAKVALETAITALVRDGERLDWLDDQTHQYQDPEFKMYPDGSDTYWLFTGKQRVGESGRDLRAAIDASRAASTPTSKG